MKITDRYDLKWYESYSSKYTVSQLTISNYDIWKRFEKLNRNKPLSKIIKPFNFITVGSGYQTDDTTGDPIIPIMPLVDKKKLPQVPYMPFLDYKIGIEYPNRDSLDTKECWKPMKVEFSKHSKHNDAKFEGEIGILRRKHLEIDKSSIHYIGKESNELENSEVLGVFKEDTLEYMDFQKRLREIISNLTLETALEIGISRRLFFYLRKKVEEKNTILLKRKTFEKIMLLGFI